MSQIQNVITTTFRARNNQAIASMSQVAQGFGSVGRAIYDNTRLSERLNNQWRAIGTTIRYAIAGSAVFGLRSMVGQLNQVQQQLGLIAAIGSQPGGGMGGRTLSPAQVTSMGAALRRTAVDAIQPVQQINDATINFLSTVQGAEPGQVPTIIRELGRAATLAQTPVEDMTKAATTMNIAFGRVNNLRNISQFTRQFYALTTLAPGGRQAGSQITQQLGPLSAMFALGRGNQNPAQSQAQMMSLVLASLRFGGTPATSLRGLTFLTQSLIQPASPGARRALASIGITPRSIEKEGVYANLMRFLMRIRYHGNVRQLANMDDDALANLDETGGNLPGIPATQMPFLRTALGRIHGVRAAVILAEQLRPRGDVQSLSQDFQIMTQAQRDQAEGALNMAQAWERFRKRSRLQEATIAINAMSLQVAQIFEPVLNFAAGQAAGVAGAAARHPRATRDLVLGGGAFLGALGIGRFLGVGKLLPAGLRNSAFGRLLGGSPGRGFVLANAAQAAMHGGGSLGASPQNPLYVVVVGQLFGGGTPGPGGGLPGGGGGGGGGGNWFGRIPKIIPGGARLLGGLGLLTTAYLTRKQMEEHVALPLERLVHYPGSRDFKFSPTGRPYWQGSQGIYPMSQNDERMHELRRAQQMFGRNVSGLENYRAGLIHGRAEIMMTLDINQNGKITRKRVHVPVDMWSGGRTPSAAAKQGTKRGG